MKERKKVTLLIIEAMAFAVYIYLVLRKTLFSRVVRKKYRYKTELFWSYKRWFRKNDWNLGWKIILNIIMFMPYGVIASALLDRTKLSRKGKIVICICTTFAFSCLIEVLQLVLKRGLFEFDDILNNTLGAGIGCAAYYMVKYRKWGKT